jgi:putative mRNA 3-end processing factor
MSFFTRPLIAWTPQGLYCEAGGFYIDPHRAVDLAVVTHAHSDHARRGSKHYICEKSGLGLLRVRLGARISAEGRAFGESFQLGRVKVSFHSAGHILGSAQVRVECDGEVWVASGDYKRDPDPSCEPFENVKCDTFITEATFGTPKFAWAKDVDHGSAIAEWWSESERAGRNCILFGYSLGKTQRILAELAPHARKPVLIHSTCVELTECYRQEGRTLAPTRALESALSELGGFLSGSEVLPYARDDSRSTSVLVNSQLRGEMILAPPSILKEEWAQKLGEYETAFASGWMQNFKPNPYSTGRSYDRGFVISDHADWNDLNQTILETGAKRVFVQHREGALIRHLRKQGIDAHSSDALTHENYSRLGGRALSLFEKTPQTPF